MDETRRQQFEAMMEHDHGPCWYFGMYHHVSTVKVMLEELFTWRNGFSAFLAEPPDFGEYTDDTWADVANQSAYADASISQAVIASVAPLFETLIRNAADSIRRSWGDAPLPEDQSGRAAFAEKKYWDPPLPENHFWDPTAFYKRKGALHGSLTGRRRWLQQLFAAVGLKRKGTQHRTSTDIRRGVRQLLEAIGFDEALSPDALNVMDAVFEFRNATLHEGYEWRRQKINRFIQLVKSRKWTHWFTEYTKGDEIWLIVLRDLFVSDALAALDSMARSFRRVQEEVAQRRQPQYDSTN